VFKQDPDVVLTFAEGWHVDGEDIEAVEKIGTEFSIHYFRSKIVICGSDDTNIYLDGLRTSDSFEFPFLQDPQEPNLRFG
jgi:hypothetical protein